MLAILLQPPIQAHEHTVAAACHRADVVRGIDSALHDVVTCRFRTVQQSLSPIAVASYISLGAPRRHPGDSMLPPRACAAPSDHLDVLSRHWLRKTDPASAM